MTMISYLYFTANIIFIDDIIGYKRFMIIIEFAK